LPPFFFSGLSSAFLPLGAGTAAPAIGGGQIGQGNHLAAAGGIAGG
jgi:hypothetical protein